MANTDQVPRRIRHSQLTGHTHREPIVLIGLTEQSVIKIRV